MSYNFDPRDALKQVCQAAAESDHFPPRSAGRTVTEAIEMLKANRADPEQVAIAEGLSVLLYRFEVSTWAKDPDEARRVRESIAAQASELPALAGFEPIQPEGPVLELSMDTALSGSPTMDYLGASQDASYASERAVPAVLSEARRHCGSIGGPDCY